MLHTYHILLDKHAKKNRWAREPKSKTARSTPFLNNLVVWAAVLCTKPT